MPALRPVPTLPLRALGVVRVSEARDDMISPEIQWTAIEDHCATRGYVLAGRIEGLDESGSQRRSPWWKKLDKAVEAVEAGEFDVIVVWKFSRVARSRLRWAVAVDRVETAGGLIESASEPLDTSTSSGRLARGMLKEFDAYQSEQIGAVWRDVHARRTRQGLPANGKPRFGYRVVDGVHRPHPDEGPALATVYRRYVAGESVYALVAWLNAEGYRTAPGYSRRGPIAWTQTTLRRVLDSGFGAGFITVGGERVRGVHEPVIDEPTWEQYLVTRAGRRTLRRSERSTYLLSGLVRCMHVMPDGRPCGSPMGGGLYGHDRAPKFRCGAAASRRAHPGGYVMMRVVETEVVEWLEQQAADVDGTAESVEVRSPGAMRQRDLDALAREAAALEQQLVELTLQLSRKVVPEATYVAARAQIEAEQAKLAERHARAVTAAAEVDAGPVAAALLTDWHGLSVAERRAILRRLIRRVEVVPGHPRAGVFIVPGWSQEKRP